MDQTFKYDEFPMHFAHCLNSECPKSHDCLHFKINEITPDDQSTITCFNPTYIKQYSTGKCPFFISSIPQKYGKGISHLFDHIPYPVAINIKNKMVKTFGHTNYYRFRREERLISPKEQELIKQFFKEELIENEPVFDSYVDYFELS